MERMTSWSPRNAPYPDSMPQMATNISRGTPEAASTLASPGSSSAMRRLPIAALSSPAARLT